MQTVTKKSMTQAISRKKGMDPKEVRIVLQEMLDYMTENLSEGKRFEFRDFGVFEVVRRKQKVGRNPKNPKSPIIIPERNVVKFTPGKELKSKVHAT